MTPSRESYSASGRPAAASTTRSVSENQHFFSARSATASSIGRSTGNSREVSRPGNGGSNMGSNHVSSNNGAISGSNNGFRRFGELGSNNVAGPRSNSNSNVPRSSGPVSSPVPRSEPQGNSNWGSAPRPGNATGSTPARESGNSSGGWQRFSPMPPRASSPESGRVGESSGPYGTSRGSASQNRGYGGYSRPPLNMRQPIVTPRAYGGGRYGGGRPAPSYGGGRSAPSHSSGHSAPSGGSSHGGGGSSHGGGGGGGGGRHGK